LRNLRIDPSLPLIKIRRENVGSHAKTCFQNKLCDVLYEGSSIPNAFFMENEEFLGFLKTERDNFLDEVDFFLHKFLHNYRNLECYNKPGTSEIISMV